MKKIREIKAMDALVFGDFNEDENAKHAQDLLVEMGQCEVLSESHEVGEKISGSEGILNVA